MPRIALLSDIHLSPTHGFFWDNWRIARDHANASDAEAVIINGDLAINGPDSDDELAFAARALARLNKPVFALPGNHDVGDEPPGQDAHQLIDSERLARWDRAFGRDRYALTVGDWLVIGVNAQLFGSGLPREENQNSWLDMQLAEADDRFVALFLHKPLFLESPSEDVVSAACMTPHARSPLLARLRQADVRLVLSGHLHQHRDRIIGGVRHVWAPAVAFAAPHDNGGDPACGLMMLDFQADRIEIEIEQPPGLISHDLAAIKQNGRYKFLRDMPPSPPPDEEAEAA